MTHRTIAFAALLAASSGAYAQSYNGRYGCTSDCSGHDAGYQWAERNYITDPYDCRGNSQSFIEGCQAYAEEQQEQREQEEAEAREDEQQELQEQCDDGDEYACDELEY